MPRLDKRFRHRSGHWHFNEPKSIMFATDTLSKLYTLLQVEVYLVFFWRCAEAKPGRHAVVLQLAYFSLAFVELKSSCKFVHELRQVIVSQEMRLLLECVLDENQVDGFEAKILARGGKLVGEELRMHAVDATRHVFFCDYILGDECFN